MKKLYIHPAVIVSPISFVSCLCGSSTTSDSFSGGDKGADQGGARAPHRTTVF